MTKEQVFTCCLQVSVWVNFALILIKSHQSWVLSFNRCDKHSFPTQRIITTFLIPWALRLLTEFLGIKKLWGTKNWHWIFHSLWVCTVFLLGRTHTFGPNLKHPHMSAINNDSNLLLLKLKAFSSLWKT